MCVPFSIASAHEAARAHVGVSGAEALAVEPLWQQCLNAGLAGHDGTTLAAAGTAVETKGQTTEQCWPYNASLGAGTEPEPAMAARATWFRAGTIEMPLAHDGIESLAEDALTIGCAVVVIIEVTDEFEHPTPGGEITVPALTAPTSDYHAVLALGAATDPAGTSRRLLVRNTWGPGWGAGGYGWLPLDYLIAFAGQAAIVDPTSLTASAPAPGGTA